MKLQKLGGYAAIGAVIGFLIGLLMAGYNMKLVANNGGDLAKAAAALPAAWLYVFLRIKIVPLILSFVMLMALYERMHTNAPYLTRAFLIAGSAGTAIEITRAIVTIAGLQSVLQDSSALKAFLAITGSLEVAWGHAIAWSCLLSGCAILRTRALSRALGWFSILVSIWWIPQFTQAQMIPPALLSLVGLLWTGIELLRQKQPQPALKEMAASS
jgi:hypothetical protein